MRKIPAVAIAAIAITTFAPLTTASAWTVPGHSRVARAAMKILPESMPAFFRADAETVAHMAVDPDAMKQRELTALYKSEGPEHYLDLEFLKGHALPIQRYDYLKLVDRLSVDPEKVGMLPYSIMEGTQRLTVAFAEYRQWPDDPTIQAKIGFYAGLLSHYAGDLAQPLHTTIHHDGRAQDDGSSPHTGIHLKIDRIFEILPEDDGELLAGLQPAAFENLWTAFHAQLQESHSHVDTAYALDEVLNDLNAAAKSDPAQQFARDRYRTGALFIAGLYITAWEQSADVELPWWLEYPGLEKVGR